MDIPRLSVAVPTIDPGKSDYIVEVAHRRFNLRTYPNVKYHEGVRLPHRFYTTRAMTVKELHLKICEAIERDSVKFTAIELFSYSRMWVFE